MGVIRRIGLVVVVAVVLAAGYLGYDYFIEMRCGGSNIFMQGQFRERANTLLSATDDAIRRLGRNPESLAEIRPELEALGAVEWDLSGERFSEIFTGDVRVDFAALDDPDKPFITRPEMDARRVGCAWRYVRKGGSFAMWYLELMGDFGTVRSRKVVFTKEHPEGVDVALD